MLCTEGDFGTNVVWIETACKDLVVISSFAAVCDCCYCTVSIYFFFSFHIIYSLAITKTLY